jgi:hypothetical protein
MTRSMSHVLPMHTLLQVKSVCHSSCTSGFLTSLPRNVFYQDHTTLVVILCTVRQSFPCQLLFQCWDPYDILHWTFHTDTFCHNKHTQGKLPGHTKFWYPSGDWLGWRYSSEDPCTPGLWQVCYSSGLARGSHLHPPSPLPLGSPGGCSSKKTFFEKRKNLRKTRKHLAWREVSGQGIAKKLSRLE